jgi:hypothetical protein
MQKALLLLQKKDNKAFFPKQKSYFAGGCSLLLLEEGISFLG